MRVLLIKPSSFGDIIHTLPISHALKSHSQVEKLDWVINEEYASLLEENPDVNRVISFPRKKWLSSALAQFLKELRREYYDWVIDLQGLFRSGLMTALARGKRKIGMRDSREGAGFFYSEQVPITTTHAIERYKEVLNYLEVKCETLNFFLPTISSIQSDVPNSFILIHPYSRWFTKELPDELVRELVENLAPKPVVIIGQGETKSWSGAIDFTNRTNLKELIYLIKKADAIISTDSGPMHIAAAFKKPLVTLFGPTSPQKTGPWTENSRTLQLSLPCAPCLSRQCKLTETKACLMRITVTDVLQALTQVMY